MLEKLLDQKKHLLNPAGDLLFPPPVAKLLEGEVIDYQKGQSMTMRFPIKEEYNNPFKITFGGVYAMFFDMAFGPFSSIEAEAGTTSLDLNVSFIKPLSVQDEYVTVVANIVNRSRQFLIMEGKAYKGDQILVATCTSRMLILNQKLDSKNNPS